MRKIIYLLCLLLLTPTILFSQESFKKKYFIPTKLANDIALKKDTIIKFENYTKQDSIKKMYKETDFIEVVTNETIDGKTSTVTRKVKVDDAFYKSLSFKRSLKVIECGIVGYVKFEDDGKLIVNRYLNRDSKGDYTRYPLHFYQLQNRQTVTLSFCEWSVATLVIPIKYRFKGRNGLEEDFSTAFNANLFGGYTWGKSNFFHQEKVGNKTNTRKFTLGALIGISTAELDKNNTSLDANPLGEDKKLTKGLASFGIGGTYAFNKINIGVFAGKDYAVGDDGSKWNYNKKPWIGLAIGYSLFNF